MTVVDHLLVLFHNLLCVELDVKYRSFTDAHIVLALCYALICR